MRNWYKYSHNAKNAQIENILNHNQYTPHTKHNNKNTISTNHKIKQSHANMSNKLYNTTIKIHMHFWNANIHTQNKQYCKLKYTNIQQYT